MKIFHVCNYFSFNMGYQNNLLPIGHKNIGNDVVIYTSDRECRYSYNIDSRIVKPGIYNYHGIKLIRDEIFFEAVNRFTVFKNLYNSLNIEEPDYIFHHGITSPSIFTVIKYKKKHRDCKLVFDVHVDFNNSMQGNLSKIYHSFWGIIWKNMIKFTDKIFYVAPECKKFISTIYKIPDDKLKYLPLGGDSSTLEKHDYSFVKNIDTICICVPTPLDIYQQPNLSYVKNSTENIAKYLRQGMLVILESTTYPGTTEELVKPILEKESGLKCGQDFFLAFSPERIDPGNPWYKVRNTPKVVGGVTPDCTEVTSYLYRNIIQGKVYPVSSPKVAEMEKIYENVFRYTNIALANEMSILCHKMGIDFWEVIEAAKTKPYGFMPFYPGPGIGGHCIHLDPFYLTWKAREYNYHTRLIELSGEINKYMPEYVVERTAKILSRKFKKSLNGAKVLLLGVAYKKDINDLRQSPALEIIEKLEEEKVIVYYYDPYIPEFINNGKKYKSLKKLTAENIIEMDVIVITVAHTAVDYKMVAKNAKAVFDTRNAIKDNSDNVEKL